MKQLSAFYGGALATNNKEFIDFFNKEEKLNKDFFFIKINSSSYDLFDT